MMKLKRIQTKHIAHLIMLTFACASLFNLQAYLDTMHHNAALSWTLGGSLAFALVVMAALLSELNWNFKDSKFLTLLIVTIGLTTVSGAIQGSAYAHDGNTIAGYLMGFALPGLGELGIALALSAYKRSQDGREVTEAQRQLAIGVRSHLVEAIANIDRTKIEAQVNRAVNIVTRELVDNVVADMVAELRSNRVVQIEQPIIQDEVNLPAQLEAKTDVDPILDTEKERAMTDSERMQQGKQRKIEARRNTMLAILRAKTPTVSELSTELDASPNTIRNDLTALQSQGFTITVNGVVKLEAQEL